MRDFTSAGIERPEIEALINTAIEAPSAMNLQPWAFAVVLDRSRVDDYARRAKEWLLANPSRFPFTADARRMLEEPRFTIFYSITATEMPLWDIAFSRDDLRDGQSSRSPGTESRPRVCPKWRPAGRLLSLPNAHRWSR